MRLAFISTILAYPWGGADTLWTRAAEAANERSDTIFISVSPAVAAHPRVTELAKRGVRVHARTAPFLTLPFRTRLLRKLGIVQSEDAELTEALRKFQPDSVIFSQGGGYDLVMYPELTAWLRASGTKYQIVVNWQQEHPQLDDAPLAFIREGFAAAHVINFVSTRNLTVTRRHLGIPLAQARVIQNPLRWEPADITPWPSGPTTNLATVSRLDESKGIQLLLHALAQIATTVPAWQLNIYGQGPHDRRLHEIVAQLGLGSRIHFQGYVSQLRTIWAANHLMISPALEDGVPMTIPEAMLCQRPVLATCVGGAEDWLTDESTGFLCPVADVSSLTATLQKAFAARESWQAMGQAAAAAARDRYQPTDYLQLITP